MPYKDIEKQREYGRVMMNKQRLERKIKAVEYKGGKCIKCGYNKCIGALQFHHRDKKTKKFQIGGCDITDWEVIKKELDKCDLLCANCHHEIEYELSHV